MENELRGAVLNASIPGESLTAELGGYPWQRPPEHPTIDEAVMFYSEKLSDPKASSGLAALLDSGVTIKQIVNTTVNAGVMEGFHTLDVGVLVTPVLIEMMSLIGDEAGIKYTTGFEDDDSISDVARQAVIRKVANKFAEKVEDTKPADIPPLPTEPMSNGLMSRPSPAMEQPTEEGAML